MFTVKTVWRTKCKTRENTKTSSCCIVFIIMLWSLTNLQEELWAVKICTSPENCLLFKAFVKMLDAASSHGYYVRKTMNFKVVFNHFPNLLSFLAVASPKYNASITKLEPAGNLFKRSLFANWDAFCYHLSNHMARTVLKMEMRTKKR